MAVATVDQTEVYKSSVCVPTDKPASDISCIISTGEYKFICHVAKYECLSSHEGNANWVNSPLYGAGKYVCICYKHRMMQVNANIDGWIITESLTSDSDGVFHASPMIKAVDKDAP